RRRRRHRRGPVTAPVAARPGGDLDRRAAVHDLVVLFYREIVFDDLLEPVFDEVAEIDWTVHIPRLVDYWCQVLLGAPGSVGALEAAHRHVHDIEALRVEHFDRWYGLWERCVDAGWSGPHAEHAKAHAARMATSLARRLLDVAWHPPG